MAQVEEQRQSPAPHKTQVAVVCLFRRFISHETARSSCCLVYLVSCGPSTLWMTAAPPPAPHYMASRFLLATHRHPSFQRTRPLPSNCHWFPDAVLSFHHKQLLARNGHQKGVFTKHHCGERTEEGNPSALEGIPGPLEPRKRLNPFPPIIALRVVHKQNKVMVGRGRCEALGV